MEKLLGKLTIQPPPPGTLERVLADARREFLRAAGEVHWTDRLWASRTYWYSTAAAALISLAAVLVTSGAPASATVAALPPDPSAADMAKEIARALGDGPALEKRLAAAFSGAQSTGAGGTISKDELLRSVQ